MDMQNLDVDCSRQAVMQTKATAATATKHLSTPQIYASSHTSTPTSSSNTSTHIRQQSITTPRCSHILSHNLCDRCKPPSANHSAAHTSSATVSVMHTNHSAAHTSSATVSVMEVKAFSKGVPRTWPAKSRSLLATITAVRSLLKGEACRAKEAHAAAM